MNINKNEISIEIISTIVEGRLKQTLNEYKVPNKIIFTILYEAKKIINFTPIIDQ